MQGYHLLTHGVGVQDEKEMIRVEQHEMSSNSADAVVCDEGRNTEIRPKKEKSSRKVAEESESELDFSSSGEEGGDDCFSHSVEAEDEKYEEDEDCQDKVICPGGAGSRWSPVVVSSDDYESSGDEPEESNSGSKFQYRKGLIEAGLRSSNSEVNQPRSIV